jgi:predicted lipoprotein
MRLSSPPLSALVLAGLAAIGLAACIGGGAEQRAGLRSAVLVDLSAAVIAPDVSQFATDAADLAAQVQALTESPDRARLDAAQAAWLETARAWHRLASLDLAGITRTGLLYSRIGARPTSPGAIERALATPDPIGAAYVARQGADKRGLAGLEYLLFTQDPAAAVSALQGSEARRNYLLGVAQDLAAQADALAGLWDRSGGDELGMFERADSEGRNLQSSVSRLVNQMSMTTETMAYVSLGRPLGLGRSIDTPDGPPAPDLVPAPYARESVALLRAELSGLRALVSPTASGGTDRKGIDALLLDLGAEIGDEPLGEALLGQIDAADAALAALDGSLYDAVTNDPEAVRTAYDEALALHRLVKTSLANWLAVGVTFSDNDGD